MTKDKQAEEIAALRKELDELKSALAPKPKSDFVPMTDEQHRDWVHQTNERRMSLASNFHPDDLRAMERACPTPMMKEIALRDARGPTSPGGMVPSSSGQVQGPSGGTGWVEPVPLSNPPGTFWVDAIAIADDVKQRKGNKP